MAILKTSSTLRLPRRSLSSPPKRFGPEKCPVYLRVPCIGKAFINLVKEVNTAVESCYGSLSTLLVFTSKRMLPVVRKDVLPIIQKVLPYMNVSATVMVGTQSKHLNDYRIVSSNMFCNGKTAIDPSTPISTTQIVQTKRHQTGF